MGISKRFSTYLTVEAYSSAVWNPYLKGGIEALEKVQKYALKVCTKSWDASYEDLLSKASLPSLQRRIQTSLCHPFKIINELTDFPEAPVSIRQSHYNSRSGQQLLRLCQYQHLEPAPTITLLPTELRNSDSLIHFKCHLSECIL